MTPMFLVIVALGTTDLLFALDSIPAIYGLTQEPYMVFTANVFALMGLRQLYFLLGDLLKRLVYLSQGLAFILAFIGVKLVLHALHENELPFINGGEHVPVPEIPTLLCLGVIIVTLIITTVASLYKTRVHDQRNGGNGATAISRSPRTPRALRTPRSRWIRAERNRRQRRTAPLPWRRAAIRGRDTRQLVGTDGRRSANRARCRPRSAAGQAGQRQDPRAW